jgi:hydroxypyruvate reductase
VVSLLISDARRRSGQSPLARPARSEPLRRRLRISIATAFRRPERVRAFSSGREESIKPGDPRLARCTQRIIASPRMALEAAARARAQGLATQISVMICREAREPVGHTDLRGR